ncbi:hypothetical protein A2U01_0049074, partial [Trifolium medium]|nr:hypothetical protein [Trifolium medium]
MQEIIFGFWRVLEMVQRCIQEEEDSASCKKSEKRVNFQRSSSTKSAKEASKDWNKAHSAAKDERCLAKRKVDCLRQWYHVQHNTQREIFRKRDQFQETESNCKVEQAAEKAALPVSGRETRFVARVTRLVAKNS